MRIFKKRYRHLCHERQASLLALILGWFNLTVFILTFINYKKYVVNTEFFILPIAVINITAAVALTLLFFCLIETGYRKKRAQTLLTAVPSLLVVLLMIYFVQAQGSKWIYYFFYFI